MRARGARWVFLNASTHDPRLVRFYADRGYETGQQVVECVKMLDTAREETRRS